MIFVGTLTSYSRLFTLFKLFGFLSRSLGCCWYPVIGAFLLFVMFNLVELFDWIGCFMDCGGCLVGYLLDGALPRVEGG